MDNVTLFFTIFNLHGHSQILDQLIIFAAEPLIYLIMLLSLVLIFKGGIKEKKAFLLAFLGIIIAILLIKFIHLFFFEPRPWVTFNLAPLADHSPDASFPSRHATIIAVIAFTYIYFKSKWSILFLPVMLLIGFSRVFVGVHYPLDILGGFITAIVALTVALQIKKLIEKFFLRI